MLEKIVPKRMMKPFNNAYSHGVVIPANARVLHVSGQIGAAADGALPVDAAQQAENAWHNVKSVVEAAGMGIEDIAKLTAYIVDEAAFVAYAAARNRDFSAITPPAATAFYVPGLVLPEWKIEIEALAARVE